MNFYLDSTLVLMSSFSFSPLQSVFLSFFFFNDTATTEIYTLSLHDALPISVCPSQFATRRTLFHVLVGCGLLMLKVSRLKLPVIWLLVSMWLNTLTKSQIWTLLLKV